MSCTISGLGGILQRYLLASNSSMFQTEKPFESYEPDLTNTKTNELKKGFQSNTVEPWIASNLVCECFTR
jgi:hypothetical protein